MKNEVNDTNVNNNVTPEMPVNNVSNETPLMPEMQSNVAPNMAANVAPTSAAPAASLVTGLKSGLTIGGVHLSLQALIAIAVVVVLVVAGVVFKVATSTPKAVFKGVVNNAYKEVHKALNEYEKFNKKFSFADAAMYANADISLDTNIEEIKAMEDEYGISLKDYKLKGEVGIDAENKKMIMGAGIEGNDSTIDFTAYLEEDTMYLASSLFEEVLYTSIEDTDFEYMYSDLEEAFDVLEQAEDKVNPDDLDYVAKAVTNAINKSFVSDALSKESDKVEVDGKDIKVTKYTYEIDDKVAKDMFKVISEELAEDEKVVKIISDMLDVSKSDTKDFLESLEELGKEWETEVVIELYTRGLFNASAGFSIEVDNEKFVECYTDGKKTEMIIGEEEVVIVAEEEKKSTKVEVEVEEEKIAEVTIREMSEKLIDFDLAVFEEDEEAVKVSLYLSSKENKESITGDYKVSLEMDGEYMKLSGSYTISSKDGISMNTDDAVDAEDVNEEELMEQIEDNLSENEELLNAIKQMQEDAEEQEIQENLNYNGMYEVEESKAIELLTKKKATVLYVGTYSYSDPYFDFWYDLEDLQDELDFYSYYLNSSYNDVSEVITAAGDVPYSCTLAPAVETPAEGTPAEGTETEAAPAVETSTCEETPIIYLIKDGKVVKGLRIGTTKEEMKAALAEIGIE